MIRRGRKMEFKSKVNHIAIMEMKNMSKKRKQKKKHALILEMIRVREARKGRKM
jgi:hypothetical protein